VTRTNADRHDATATLLRAVHDTLDEAVTRDGTPVPHYENVPERAKPPYYVSGPSDMTPDAVQTEAGGYGGAQRVDLQLDTFSSYRGKKEVSELQDEAIGVLAEASLAGDTGRRLTNIRVVETRIQQEPQQARATYHGIATLRFRIQLASP
jgi:hypothetical protein